MTDLEREAANKTVAATIEVLEAMVKTLKAVSAPHQVHASTLGAADYFRVPFAADLFERAKDMQGIIERRVGIVQA